MTVYLDDLCSPNRVERSREGWSQLVTDNPDISELHAFAARVGLKRSWFSDRRLYSGDAGRPHYDVPDSRRRAVLKAGATPISANDTLTILRRARAATTGP